MASISPRVAVSTACCSGEPNATSSPAADIEATCWDWNCDTSRRFSCSACWPRSIASTDRFSSIRAFISSTCAWYFAAPDAA
jgi:hypothetical protein